MTGSISNVANYNATKIDGKTYLTMNTEKVDKNKVKNGCFTDPNGNIFIKSNLKGKEIWISTKEMSEEQVELLLKEQAKNVIHQKEKSGWDKFLSWGDLGGFTPGKNDRCLWNLWNGFGLFDKVNQEYDNAVSSAFKPATDWLMSDSNPNDPKMSAGDFCGAVGAAGVDIVQAVAQNPIKTATTAAVFTGLCLIPGAGPFIALGAAAIGVVTGLWGLGKGIYNGIKANTKQEKKEAVREGVRGTIIAALSAIGLKRIKTNMVKQVQTLKPKHTDVKLSPTTQNVIKTNYIKPTGLKALKNSDLLHPFRNAKETWNLAKDARNLRKAQWQTNPPKIKAFFDKYGRGLDGMEFTQECPQVENYTGLSKALANMNNTPPAYRNYLLEQAKMFLKSDKLYDTSKNILKSYLSAEQASSNMPSLNQIEANWLTRLPKLTSHPVITSVAGINQPDVILEKELLKQVDNAKNNIAEYALSDLK